MQSLMYIPPGGGEAIELKAKVPYIFSQIKGIGGVESDVLSSEIVGMQGSVFHAVKKGPRVIDCTVYVSGISRREMYQNRMQLIGSLRTQNKMGTVYYTNDHISVKTNAIVLLPGDFSERLKNYSRADIRLWCPDPDWLSLEVKRARIAAIKGNGFRLPFSFPVSFSHVENEIIVQNMGTAETPVIIKITGPGVNPSITNMTTGQKITLDNRSLGNDEQLIINTQRGNKSVIIVQNGIKSDGFQYISPVSDFWTLVPGQNKIIYSSDDNSEATSIEVEWIERYEGV